MRLEPERDIRESWLVMEETGENYVDVSFDFGLIGKI
jgi:hypothetical protein